MSTFFITGTDTDCGKTYCTVALLNALKQQQHTAWGFKPIASGADGKGYNPDVLALQQASYQAKDYAQHNVYTFQQATAPHLAAEQENIIIQQETLNQGLQFAQQQAEIVLVEGAGGWFTPLDEHTLYSDWVTNNKLPVILVVGMKLGCINHALLTAHAVCTSGLSLHGWIANFNHPECPTDYLRSLQQRLNAPLIGTVGYQQTGAFTLNHLIQPQ